MSRIRSIKPEFWTSEQVMECSPLARLAFIGMWNFCDDQGVHPGSVKTLKAEVFPGDDISTSAVNDLVSELKAEGLIVEFSANDKLWWSVTGWHHQLIKNPSAPKYPPPPRPSSNTQESPSPTPVLPQSYPSPTVAIPQERTQEGKGRERKGLKPSVDQAALTTPRDDAAAESAPDLAIEPDATTGRAIELTALLRKRGASLQASDPRVRAWAAKGISDAAALTALETAQERRSEEGSSQPISSGLLDVILADSIRAGPKRRKSIHDQRKDTLDTLTGRSLHATEIEPRDISAEVIRIA